MVQTKAFRDLGHAYLDPGFPASLGPAQALPRTPWSHRRYPSRYRGGTPRTELLEVEGPEQLRQTRPGPQQEEQLLSVLHEDSQIYRVGTSKACDDVEVPISLLDDIGESTQDPHYGSNDRNR